MATPDQSELCEACHPSDPTRSECGQSVTELPTDRLVGAGVDGRGIRGGGMFGGSMLEP